MFVHNIREREEIETTQIARNTNEGTTESDTRPIWI